MYLSFLLLFSFLFLFSMRLVSYLGFPCFPLLLYFLPLLHTIRYHHIISILSECYLLTLLNLRWNYFSKNISSCNVYTWSVKGIPMHAIHNGHLLYTPPPPFFCFYLYLRNEFYVIPLGVKRFIQIKTESNIPVHFIHLWT